MTNTEAAQAEFSKGILGAFHLFERFRGDATSVLDARGEAGGGGLVPDIERGVAGQHADIVLGQARISERGEYGVLDRCLLAGAVVAGVVGIEAVDHMRHAARHALAFENAKELILAMEATSGVVARVVFAGELASRNGDQRDILRRGKGDGLAPDDGAKGWPSRQ